MTTQTTRTKILEKLQLLPDSALDQVLNFVEFLTQKSTEQPVGVPGQQLLLFAGTISSEDLVQMAQAIETDCGRVDLSEW